MSVIQSVSQSVSRSVSQSVCKSVSLSVCQSVSLSVCQSVSLSVCLFVYLLLCFVYRERQTNIRETKLHREFSRRQNDRPWNVHLPKRNATTWRVHRRRGGARRCQRNNERKERRRNRTPKPHEAGENQVD